MKKAVIVFSGGVDSVCAVSYLKSNTIYMALHSHMDKKEIWKYLQQKLLQKSLD